MRIQLYLHRQCIETTAKKEYKRLLDCCFSTHDAPEPDIEEKLMLLQDFIERSDFSFLRSSDERLSGSTESSVTIYRDNEGSVQLRIA